MNTVIEIIAAELVNTLANALPFAATDKTLPVLNAVMLRASGGDLSAQSTDRYRLAEVLGAATFVDPDLRLLVSVEDCKRTVALLKPLLKASPNAVVAVSLAPNDHDVRIETAFGAVTVANVEGEYPRIRAIFPDNVASGEDACGANGYTPRYLESFAKVKDLRPNADKNARMLLVGGQLDSKGHAKPTSILHGDWFRGLLMPVRLVEGKPADVDLARFNSPAPISERATELMAQRASAKHDLAA